MARYEVADGVAHKFWEITLAGKTFTVRWGRLGTRGQSQVKQFASDGEARREYDKLVREKHKKGYKLVDGIEESAVATPVSTAPAARSPELEAHVIANPDDEGALMVLGDWLQTQGDPRGELISLQAALKQAGADPKLFLERKRVADLHYKQHEAALLGPLFPLRHLFRLEWHLGYIRGAKLSCQAAVDGDPDLVQLLRHVVDVPAAIALQELGFDYKTSVERSRMPTYQLEIDALAEHGKPAALRSLAFGDFGDFSLGFAAQYPSTFGNLEALDGVFPQLRRLSLSCKVTFGKLRLPELRYLDAHGVDWGWVATCSKLEHLVVDKLPVNRAEPLPAAKLPKLRRLKIEYSPNLDLLAQMTVLPQLEGLDLASVTVADGTLLAERAAAFGHLKTFRVTLVIPNDGQDYDALIRRLRKTNADLTIKRNYR